MVTGYPVYLTLHCDSDIFQNIYCIIYLLPAQSPPQIPTTKVLYSVYNSSIFIDCNFLRCIAFLFLAEFGVFIDVLLSSDLLCYIFIYVDYDIIIYIFKNINYHTIIFIFYVKDYYLFNPYYLESFILYKNFLFQLVFFYFFYLFLVVYILILLKE